MRGLRGAVNQLCCRGEKVEDDLKGLEGQAEERGLFFSGHLWAPEHWDAQRMGLSVRLWADLLRPRPPGMRAGDRSSRTVSFLTVPVFISCDWF